MQFTINNVIELIRYFAPGLIFLYIFRYVTNKDDKLQMDGNNFVVIVLISYIAINIFVALISMCGVTTYSIDSESLSLWDAILIGVICILAIVSGLIRNCLWIEKNILAKFLHRTYNDNVWESLKDVEKGNYVTLFKKNEEVIYGMLHRIFVEEKETFFVLSQYVIYDNNGEKEDFSESNLKLIVIPLSELNSAEIIYDRNSRKIEKLAHFIPKEKNL